MRPCVTPRPVRYALGPEPGSLPQDHPGSGVVALWLPPGQLHGMSSTSPSSPCCPVCCMCIGASTAGGARGSEAASTAYSFGDFPRKDALDARLCVCVCVCFSLNSLSSFFQTRAQSAWRRPPYRCICTEACVFGWMGGWQL